VTDAAVNHTVDSGPDVGEPAPDFELRDQRGRPIRLSSLRDQKIVVLVFYPLTFTRVCGSELTRLRDEIDDFMNDDVALFGISVDSSAVQRTYADAEYLGYPLLSDFWPHGAVAKSYGILDEETGQARRATFIIDKAGIVRWKVVNDLPDARSTDDYRAAIAELRATS
jgi:peroxiredoxin